MASTNNSLRPGRPRLDNPTENSFTAEWDPVPGAVSYKLFVREYPKEWEKAEVISITEAKLNTTIEDRFPTSTYQLRVVAVMADGTETAPSEEATVDTAVGNCAPKADEKKKCVIM
jgi:hypothetical protein